MTICRITRLSSATRIFTGTPSSVMRGSVMSTGQGRQCALHGDGDRLAPPADVDADDVGGVPDGGGRPDLGQAQGGGAGEGGLDVAADDVGDLAEGVDDVEVLEHLGRGRPEQGAGELLGGGASGGQDDGARPRADDLDPAGERLRRQITRQRDEHLLLADQRDPHLVGDGPHGRLADQVRDDRARVGGAASLPGVERGHRTTSCGSSPSSASLSRMASAVNGLMTYSWAPAASARTIWPCSLSEVTIMIVTCRQAGLERTAETNCSPSITGMFQSTHTSSGTQPPWRMSSPSRPWPACCTSYPRSSRIPATMRRMTFESSITRARTITFPSAGGRRSCGRRRPAPRSRPPRASSPPHRGTATRRGASGPARGGGSPAWSAGRSR